MAQKDNGLEFRGYFDKYLKDKGYKHLFIYPRCPKINAYVERSNRTLPEEFIKHNLTSLHISLDQFNRELIDYLVWHNTKRDICLWEIYHLCNIV